MPVPPEYQRATDDFYAFLTQVREIAGLWSTHAAYTMTQAVFQTFRRRLAAEEAIAFANILPPCLSALFIADWNRDEGIHPFADPQTMLAEVKALRPDHNFSTDTAISDVATALRKHVDEHQLANVLDSFPEGSVTFWKV